MATEKRPDFTPSSLFATDETVTVYLFQATKDYPSGIWVTLKKGLNYGEKLAVQGAFFKGLKLEAAREMVANAEATGQTTLLTDTGSQKQLKLATWIHDWNFPNAFGKSVPWPGSVVERLAVIYNLDDRVGEWLEAEIDKLAGEAAEVEQADPDSPEALSDPLVSGAAVVELVPTR